MHGIAAITGNMHCSLRYFVLLERITSIHIHVCICTCICIIINFSLFYDGLGLPEGVKLTML